MQQPPKRHIGKVVYWNYSSAYGFVEAEDNKTYYFQTNKELKDRIALLCEISFEILEKEGKYFAKDVEFIRTAKIYEYERLVGKLVEWNGRFGFIKSVQIDKPIFIYHTRFIYPDSILEVGDLIVFSPTKSTRNPEDIFAFFAYPIIKEKNLKFLLKQYEDTQEDEILNYSMEVANLATNIFLDDKFELELRVFSHIKTEKKYKHLSDRIKHYKKKYKYSPYFDLLQKYCSEKYLIQLWENQVIQYYDFDLMKNYFLNTSAENKRTIILLFSKKDKEKILTSYFNKLKDELKLTRVNNNLKTLLDLVYKNENSRNLVVFNIIKEYLNTRLQEEDFISLWLGGYIDELPEKLIVDNFDIDNSSLVKGLIRKQDKKSNEALMKIYENYFFQFSKDNFDTQYPQIIKRLFIFEKEFFTRYKEIILAVQAKLNLYQRFILWVFGVSIDFDAKKYLIENYETISEFYKIKFFIHKSIDNTQEHIKELVELQKIDQSKLEDFFLNFNWNILVQPTQINPEIDEDCYVLQDISIFQNKYNIEYLNLENVANVIYNSIPKYQVQHIRLWLYKYVNQNLYNYVGYRESFKQLTFDEQDIFKQKVNESSYMNDVLEPERLEVLPCKKIIKETEISRTYQAYLENIYFKNNALLLRKEDGNYTKEKQEVYASSGFNRIPSSSILNKKEIIIEVSKLDNEIIKIEGLEDIFTLIHTGEIEKALGIVNTPIGENTVKNKSYVEDWKLRKLVIDFLNENQFKNLEPKTIYEPKNFYRRLDENSGIDNYELTRLFSIETSDGFGIIWENIDLTEDRATYIFKSNKENHKTQLENITNAITSYAQFRSAVSNTKESEELRIFKNSFGFITSIHKQRGKNVPFENWQDKLQTALKHSILEVPSSSDLEKIKNWTPEISHSAKVSKIKKITEEEISFSNVDYSGKLAPVKIEQSIQTTKKYKTLTALKSFNLSFLQNFNIE